MLVMTRWVFLVFHREMFPCFCKTSGLLRTICFIRIETNTKTKQRKIGRDLRILHSFVPEDSDPCSILHIYLSLTWFDKLSLLPKVSFCHMQSAGSSLIQVSWLSWCFSLVNKVFPKKLFISQMTPFFSSARFLYQVRTRLRFFIQIQLQI